MPSKPAAENSSNAMKARISSTSSEQDAAKREAAANARWMLSRRHGANPRRASATMTNWQKTCRTTAGAVAPLAADQMPATQAAAKITAAGNGFGARRKLANAASIKSAVAIVVAIVPTACGAMPASALAASAA